MFHTVNPCDRFQNLIESSPDMIYEIDQDGHFIYANQSTIEKTGYPLEELKKISCWELIAPDYRKKVQSFYKKTLKIKGTQPYYEFPILPCSGKQIWVGQSVKYQMEGDTVKGASIISKDVTKLVETRNQLKEAEERSLAEKTLLNTMIFSSPASIAMFNRNFKYLAFSENWESNRSVNERIVGIGEEKDCSERRKEIIERVLHGEEFSSESELFVGSDGSKQWMTWKIAPWNNTTDGSIGGIMAYTNDITKIMKQQEELEEAKKEAQRSQLAKEEFLSQMSHEIRTPLNAIIGTTNLMIEENPELLGDQKFKLLKFSSNNLLSLINNVLDYSKIKAGHISVIEREFNLVELVNNLVESWKPLASEKLLKLEKSYDENLPSYVKGDPVRLSQVINNLLNNAIKFTNKGFVKLTIRYDPIDERVKFEILDSGAGIPENQQAAVFESFKQVHQEDIHQTGGTGLGLPICQKLIKMMGSELHLNSEVGIGSKFHFDLNMPTGKQGTNCPAETKTHSLSNLQVLLVEDNYANQYFAKRFIEKWGAQVQVASNGAEAIKYLEYIRFDIILLDLQMPVMDGYACSKVIRNMQGTYYANVPIIALTASTSSQLKSKNTDLSNFDDLLEKPFDPENLYQILVKFSGKLNLKAKHGSITPINILDHNPLRKGLMTYCQNDEKFFLELSGELLAEMLHLKVAFVTLLHESNTDELQSVLHANRPSLKILNAHRLIAYMNKSASPDRNTEYRERHIASFCKRIDVIIAALEDIVNTKKQTGIMIHTN